MTLITYGLLDELETFVVRVKNVLQADFIFESMERVLHTKNYKVTYMLFATITEDRIGVSICKNIAFVNNPT